MDDTPPKALDQWQPLILAKAQEHGLHPALVGALCWQESSGDPLARRPEPHFTWFFSPGRGPLHDRRLTTVQNRQKALTILGEEEFQFQSWSTGLMQLMGATFRELGFTGTWEQAYEPETNIHYGCRYFVLCLKRTHGDIRGALLRYNGGANPNYPAEVLRKADILAKAE